LSQWSFCLTGVMGRPGVDFPVLPSIPKTGFSCRQVKSSGYYADLDTNCQVSACAMGRSRLSAMCSRVSTEKLLNRIWLNLVR